MVCNFPDAGTRLAQLNGPACPCPAFLKPYSEASLDHRTETSPSVSAGRDRLFRRATAALLAGMLALLIAAPALAQSPTPAASPQQSGDLRILAEPLLAGHARPGSWTAVRVRVENDGPSISGELLIRGQGQQATQSRYGVLADLPTGTRKEFTLYAQTALFGSRLNVDLVSGDTTLASQAVAIKSHDAFTPIVAIVAEHPEGVLHDLEGALVNPNVQNSTVIQLRPFDLPSRVEAWAAVDRLVWQDVDAADLSDAQLDALKLWVGAGGRLVVLGGTTGPGPMSRFEELLPFVPTSTVDAQPTDLASLLGAPPSDAISVPALTGTLSHGTVLARSGEAVIAAEAGYGRGSVVMIGFNPAEPWIGGKAPGEGLWHRLMPQSSTAVLNPLQITDDSQIVYALQNLPAIDLPPIEQLFVLLLAYIALIGPVNYLILRKLDKREWAWITIPALVVVFAGASYGMGASLKGSDVIVNQIAVVRAAQGSDRGIGQAYIGIYSPSRRIVRGQHPRWRAALEPHEPWPRSGPRRRSTSSLANRARGCATSRSASGSCAASAPKRRPTRRTSRRICTSSAASSPAPSPTAPTRRWRTSLSCSAAAPPSCPSSSPDRAKRSTSTSRPVRSSATRCPRRSSAPRSRATPRRHAP